jgi:hypothetical protein
MGGEKMMVAKNGDDLYSSFIDMFDEIKDRAICLDKILVCDKCGTGVEEIVVQARLVSVYFQCKFQCKCECGHEWKELYSYVGKGPAKFPWEEKK